MPEYKLAECVAHARRFLDSRKGAVKMWELVYQRGYTLDRAIAEVCLWIMGSCHNGRLREVTYEDLAAVTERVIAAEWTMEAVA